MLSCHLKLRSKQSLQCRQCSFEEAACAESCKRKAFYQVAEGVLAIDREKCDGCGKCLEACPEQAIELREGKAVKCDLCAGNSFALSCAKACPEGRLRLLKEESESLEAEKVLGWRMESFKGKERKRLRQGNGFAIVETREGEKVYALECWPELSLPEAKLIDRVFNDFKKGEEKERSIRQCMKWHCQENLLELEEEQEEYLADILEKTIYGLGFITKLLEDEEVEEIAVIGQGKGSYATFHALSGEEALARLRNQGVKEMDLKALDLVIVQKRWTDIDLKKKVKRELRRVIEVSEVKQEGGAGLRPLFKFNYRKRRLEKAGESQRVKEKVCQAFGFTRKEFERELRKRKKCLEKGFQNETLEI